MLTATRRAIVAYSHERTLAKKQHQETPKYAKDLIWATCGPATNQVWTYLC